MRRIVFSILCFIVLSTLPTRADIFVSPSGDDSNPGTADKPIQSIEHARDLVRSLNQNMAADITVNLAPGVYRLGKPLALTPEDSGNNGHDVVYTGQNAILSGGIAVTGWKQSDASKNIWSAPAPDGLTNTRQLYVNGL